MSRFLPYIHNLRGLAILFIVGVHVRGYRWDWKPGDLAYEFFVALFDNGTVLFVFIAGFLFRHLTHDRFNFGKYLSQKAKVVMLPYLIVSLPILIMRLYLGYGELPLEKDFDDNHLLYKLVFYLATGLHMVPFWFMPMIFLIYLTAPLLHACDSSKFYSFFFPIIFFLGMFTFRPLNNANPLLAYFHFLPIYITGMWANFYKDKILKYSNAILIPIVVIYLTITVLELTDIITLNKKLSFEQVISGKLIHFNVYVFKAILLCFILMIVFYKLGDKKVAILDLLGNYSFGIYFIHYYFISGFRGVFAFAGINLQYNAAIFTGFYLLVLLFSMLTIYIIKKLTGNASRYLIGS